MSSTRRRSGKTQAADSSPVSGPQEPASSKTRRSNDTRLKALLLGYHLVLACVTNTYFQPDEYWQATEVAHRIVFGYGYLTWEWNHNGLSVAPQIRSWSDLVQTSNLAQIWQYLSSGPIRSVLHPYIFVPPYVLLRHLGVDGNFYLMTVTPRLVQAGFSTVGAWYTYRLACLLSKDTGSGALNSMLLSPYYIYTATRTFSNTTEAALSSVALFYWFSWVHTRSTTVTRDTVKALLFAAIACLLRPTNAIIWISLIPRAAIRNVKLLVHLVLLCSTIGLGSIALTTALDTHFHAGLPNVPLIPFALQNVYHSVSLFYGSHPWHWYLSQGLPVILMASLPLTLLGGARLTRSSLGREIVLIIVWTTGIYSLLGHKEWRFLQPLVPLLHILAGAAWQNESKTRGSKWTQVIRISSKRILYVMTLPFSIYLVAFHCIGQGYTLPRYIHSTPDLRSVGFLMPCHSTPWQSHFHREDLKEGRLWFVTCSPPSPGQDLQTYKDESDYFYVDPVDYFTKLLPSKVDTSFPPDIEFAGWKASHAKHLEQGEESVALHQWPSHLVMFAALLNQTEYGGQVRALLEQRGYRVEKTIWNSLFHDDPRRWGNIVVWKHLAA